MGDFKKRGGFGGGNFGGGDRPRFNRPGNREFRQTQMFDTTCAECHKPCQVPFRPNGEKPVYCNYCFGKNKAGGAGEYPRKDTQSGGFVKKDFSSAPAARTSFDGGQMNDIKKQLEGLNSKLDKLVALMTKDAPSAVAPAAAKAEAKPAAKEASLKKVVAKVVSKKKAAAKKK